MQANAATALEEHEIGVFVAPPGIGKTVLGIYGRQPITEMQLGPIRFRVDATSQAAR